MLYDVSLLKKNNLWRDMRYYGFVSKLNCRQVMDQIKLKFSQEVEKCPVLIRQRNHTHGYVIKQSIRKNTKDNNDNINDSNNIENSPGVSYNPKGPIWHHGPIGEVSGPPCNICKQHLSAEVIKGHAELFQSAETDFTNHIPIILSQGLDTGDSLLSQSDISVDSEEVWEPEVPSTNRLKFAGHTGRPRDAKNRKIFDSSEETEKTICVNQRDGPKRSGRIRKVLKDGSVSPLCNENTPTNNCYVKNQMSGIEKLNNITIDSPQCVFTQSDDEENHAELMKSATKKISSNLDEDVYNLEQIHSLRLKQNLSQANLFDMINNSIS